MKSTLLEQIILRTVDLPSMPAVAAKVMAIADSNLVSIAELEETITKDHAFSTRLLRIANSGFYKRNRQIDTVSTAMMIIGFGPMKSLAVATSMKDLMSRSGPVETMLWLHSFGVSIAASLLAVETGLVPAEEALVAGLVHDVGKTVINNSIPDRYAPLLVRPYETGISSVEIENGALGFNHCQVGGLMARKWKLPVTLEHVIEYHHLEAGLEADDQSSEMLCQLVAVADALCLKVGVGMPPVPNVQVPMDVLGISPRLSMESPSGSVRDSSRSRRTCPDRLRRLNLC